MGLLDNGIRLSESRFTSEEKRAFERGRGLNRPNNNHLQSNEGDSNEGLEKKWLEDLREEVVEKHGENHPEEELQKLMLKELIKSHVQLNILFNEIRSLNIEKLQSSVEALEKFRVSSGEKIEDVVSRIEFLCDGLQPKTIPIPKVAVIRVLVKENPKFRSGYTHFFNGKTVASDFIELAQKDYEKYGFPFDEEVLKEKILEELK